MKKLIFALFFSFLAVVACSQTDETATFTVRNSQSLFGSDTESQQDDPTPVEVTINDFVDPNPPPPPIEQPENTPSPTPQQPPASRPLRITTPDTEVPNLIHGKRTQFQFKGEGGSGHYLWELGEGPDSAQMLPNGILNWKPEGILGSVQIKVVLKDQDHPEESRFKIFPIAIHEEFLIVSSLCRVVRSMGGDVANCMNENGALDQLDNEHMIKISVKGHSTSYRFEVIGEGLEFHGSSGSRVEIRTANQERVTQRQPRQEETVTRLLKIRDGFQNVDFMNVTIKVTNELENFAQSMLPKVRHSDPCYRPDPIQVNLFNPDDEERSQQWLSENPDPSKFQHGELGKNHRENLSITGGSGEYDVKVISQLRIVGGAGACAEWRSPIQDANRWEAVKVENHHYRIEGRFRYSERLGFGEEACDHIMERLMISVSDRCETRGRGRISLPDVMKTYYIDYPQIDNDFVAYIRLAVRNTHSDSLVMATLKKRPMTGGEVREYREHSGAYPTVEEMRGYRAHESAYVGIHNKGDAPFTLELLMAPFNLYPISTIESFSIGQDRSMRAKLKLFWVKVKGNSWYHSQSWPHGNEFESADWQPTWRRRSDPFYSSE